MQLGWVHVASAHFVDILRNVDEKDSGDDLLADLDGG